MRPLKLVLFSIFLLSSAVFALTGVRAQGNDAGDTENASPEPPVTHVVKATLDDVTSATPRYEPFVFTTHADHVVRTNHDCRLCHHDLQDASPNPQPCSSCHNRPEIEPRLKNAMHQTCLGCHRLEKEKNPASPAPLACLACHTEHK